MINPIITNIMNFPEYYKSKFILLLNELEQDTGNMYQLDIFQHDVSGKIILNEFVKRSYKVEVFNMKESYKELNGIYDNLEAVESKIRQLHNIEIKLKSGTYKTCRSCSEYDENCSNCQFVSEIFRESEWSELYVDKYHCIIFKTTHSVGSLGSLIESCGTYKFIK